jgi:hypothetical protein
VGCPLCLCRPKFAAVFGAPVDLWTAVLVVCRPCPGGAGSVEGGPAALMRLAFARKTAGNKLAATRFPGRRVMASSTVSRGMREHDARCCFVMFSALYCYLYQLTFFLLRGGRAV